MSIQKGFSGIAFPFRFSGRGGVKTSTTSVNDFSHIKESIIQIVLTQKGERPMELEFGSEAKTSLFAPLHDETEQAELKFLIREALERYEDRIEVQSIDIFPDELSEEHGIGKWIVEIEFRVLKYLKNDIVRFRLN